MYVLRLNNKIVLYCIVDTREAGGNEESAKAVPLRHEFLQVYRAFIIFLDLLCVYMAAATCFGRASPRVLKTQRKPPTHVTFIKKFTCYRLIIRHFLLDCQRVMIAFYSSVNVL